ncbi:MAG TPA: class I SAM-dependent methyltransferase [Nocardioides sp.]|uniref:class I SAM-dependent methyltransferase n=1 Tax=Nocardioides sp. TaxID=35761 RepID=UPI002F42F48F
MGRRWDAAVRRSREEPNAFARDLFDGLPARYDVLEELLSLGQNRRWRTAMVDAVAEDRPGSVLDVATGTAGVALMLARRTDARITGVDLTEQMLRRGRDRVGQAGERRVSLAVGRAEQLPFADSTFDALTFTYLLRYVADPAATLRELARVVRPGGTVASLEFAVPRAPVWLPAWRLYTRVVLPSAGLVAGGREWAEVGRFLGPSIEAHYRRYPVERHVEMWREAGFEDVLTRRMSLGGGLVMCGRRTRG